MGPRIFSHEGGGGRLDRLLNKKHLARAHEFYEKYGGKAVILGFPPSSVPSAPSSPGPAP